MHNIPDSLCIFWQVDRLSQVDPSPAIPGVVRFQQLHVVEWTLTAVVEIPGSTPQLTST